MESEGEGDKCFFLGWEGGQHVLNKFALRRNSLATFCLGMGGGRGQGGVQVTSTAHACILLFTSLHVSVSTSWEFIPALLIAVFFTCINAFFSLLCNAVLTTESPRVSFWYTAAPDSPVMAACWNASYRASALTIPAPTNGIWQFTASPSVSVDANKWDL